MNGYTTVINFLITISRECRTASPFMLYARKGAEEASTQLNPQRRKNCWLKQLQTTPRHSPAAFLSLGKGPARPVTTKLKKPCYTAAGVYTASLLKWSSLPSTTTIFN